MNRLLPSLAAVLGFTVLAVAAELPAGRTLLPSNPLAELKFNGAAEFGAVRKVSLSGQPFDEVIRLETRKRPEQRYHLQARFLTVAPIAKGDTVLLTFHGRAIKAPPETGEASLGISVQRSRSPWTSTFNGFVSVGREWKEFHLPFRADASFAGGDAQLCFPVGFDPQVIDLAGVELTNYGDAVEPRQLPSTRVSYRGSEPDAPWRAAAAARIETHRKGDLVVSVLDQGRPLANAAVSVTMKRHAFGWGSAVTAELLTAETPDARRYRDTVTRLFNKVVFENDLKWPQWERAERRPTVDAAIRFLAGAGLDIRGHCLVWPSWRHLPRDLASLTNDLPALRRRVAGHVTEEMTALRGRLQEFDVINEPYSNHDLMDRLGDEVMVEWFKLAHAADPTVRLYINDYSILSAGGKDRRHQDHYAKTIRYLLDQGAPLHGIGLQCHFGSDLTPPERLLEVLDRFAEFGLPLQVTEHDIDITDEATQAAYTRDFLTALFSHPAVNGILAWGFWEGRHWRANGAYFRRDWSIKTAGQAWQDLVMKEWWTQEQGLTDTQGRFAVRGFLGEYEVVVRANGKTTTQTVTLDSSKAIAQVTLTP